MGLIEYEIKEIIKLRKKHLDGKMSTEDFMAQMVGFSNTEKLIRHEITGLVSEAKYGKTTYNRMVKANLIGEGEIIDIGTFGDEKVSCPDQNDKVITRDECYAYSSEEKHMETCQSCDQFPITRRRIFDNRPAITE